jgi:hypothetical protein
MGADVYLNSRYKPNLEKWEPLFEAAVKERDAFPRDSVQAKEAQKRVDETYGAMRSVGYHRDPYNDSGMARMMDFSWWRDVIPMLDDETGDMPIDKAKEFLTFLNEHPVKHDFVEAFVKENESEGTVDEWIKSYEKRRAQLIALVAESIALNEPMNYSL